MEFKCVQCGGKRGEPGTFNAKGMTGTVFTPDAGSRWQRWFELGAAVKAMACWSCGFIQMYADLEQIKEITSEGATRCRRCRHILRGLSAPRCPECGEPI